MAVIKCDICGGNLTIDPNGDFANCDSCGLKHTNDRSGSTDCVYYSSYGDIKDGDVTVVIKEEQERSCHIKQEQKEREEGEEEAQKKYWESQGLCLYRGGTRIEYTGYFFQRNEKKKI